MHNPLLDGQEASEEERLKRFKYDGLFIDEPAVFPLLDEDVEASKIHRYFLFEKTKRQLSKTTQAKNKFYTEEELELLRKHNRKTCSKAVRSC